MFASRPSVKSIETRSAPAAKALADVLLDLVAEVAEELLARVALDLALERVEQHQHRGRDDGLLDGLRGDRLVLLDELRGERLVAERAAGQPRQLAVVAVVEDREELAVAGEVVGEPGAGERVGDRVGREARLALLTVGHVGLAGLLEPLDRVLRRLVLLGLQLGEVDLAVVVRLEGLLQRCVMGRGSEPTSSVGIGMVKNSSSFDARQRIPRALLGGARFAGFWAYRSG